MKTLSITQGILVLAATAITGFAVANDPTAIGGLPRGTFAGKGLWFAGSKSGNYELQTTISENKISATYELPDGTTKHWNFDIKSKTANEFEVMYGGHPVGYGYCLQKTVLCHYQVTAYNVDIEETLVFEGGKLFRYGSKSDKEMGRIVWQEAMSESK